MRPSTRSASAPAAAWPHSWARLITIGMDAAREYRGPPSLTGTGWPLDLAAATSGRDSMVPTRAAPAAAASRSTGASCLQGDTGGSRRCTASEGQAAGLYAICRLGSMQACAATCQPASQLHCCVPNLSQHACCQPLTSPLPVLLLPPGAAAQRETAGQLSPTPSTPNKRQLWGSTQGLNSTFVACSCLVAMASSWWTCSRQRSAQPARHQTTGCVGGLTAAAGSAHGKGVCPAGGPCKIGRPSRAAPRGRLHAHAVALALAAA